MGHYKSNVRNLEFNLFETLGLEQVLADQAFGDLDGESVRQMLSEAARLAEGPVAESFADGDRHPPTFDPDTHVVSLPGTVQEVAGGVARRQVVPGRAQRRRRRCAGTVDGAMGSQRVGARRQPAGVHVHGRSVYGEHPLRHRQ